MSSYNFVSQYLFPLQGMERAAITPKDVISGRFKSKIVLKLSSSLITSNKIVSEKWKISSWQGFMLYFYLGKHRKPRILFWNRSVSQLDSSLSESISGICTKRLLEGHHYKILT